MRDNAVAEMERPALFLRKVARRVATYATRYVTDDRFELHRPPRAVHLDAPPRAQDIVQGGIAVSFNRIAMYAGLAAKLHGTDLGDVVEFGGSNPALSRLLTYRSWNVTPNYPKVDITNLDRYTTNSIDTVVLDNILEHVVDPAGALRECARVLRPGGHFIAAVPFLLPVHAIPDDFTRWTRHGFRNLLAKELVNVQVDGWGSREAVALMIQVMTPEGGWPTFQLACERWGEAAAWRILSVNDEAWPIMIWAVAEKSL